jgi:hypothetical protein
MHCVSPEAVMPTYAYMRIHVYSSAVYVQYILWRPIFYMFHSTVQLVNTADLIALFYFGSYVKLWQPIFLLLRNYLCM